MDGVADRAGRGLERPAPVEEPPVERGLHLASVLMAAGLCAGALAGAARGNARVAVYFGAFGVASAVVLSLRPRLPGTVQFLFVLGMALNAPGWTWKWLDRIFDYDDLAHMVTTAGFVAMAGAYTLEKRWRSLRRNLVLYTAFLITAAITGGVLWEIYEWICDRYVAVPPFTMRLSDTMEDILSDIVGAAWGSALGVHSVVRRQMRKLNARRPASRPPAPARGAPPPASRSPSR